MKNEQNLGHRERLRARFEKSGIDALQNYEVIELLLTYAIPRKDVKNIAKNLLSEFGSISDILQANTEQLCEITGMSDKTALFFNLIKDIFAEKLSNDLQEKDSFSSPKKVADYARMKLAGFQNEAFLILYLNVKNHLLESIIEANGTIDKVVIYPRNIVRNALKLNASAVIAIHNHPSGICTPSQSDKNLTKVLSDALKTLDLKLLDHIIVSSYDFFSFKGHNML